MFAFFNEKKNVANYIEEQHINKRNRTDNIRWKLEN